MNKGKKGSGFAGKAGEPRKAGDFVITSMIHRRRGTSYMIETRVCEGRKGYLYNETTACDVDNFKEPLIKDADVLGSIKAHLRACERCYYGDKK